MSGPKTLLLASLILFGICSANYTKDYISKCDERNLKAARAVGRLCRKACSSSLQCRDGKICACDHECGASCMNFENFCSAPQAIPNMESVLVYKRNLNGSLGLVTGPPYLYDDIAHYECLPGYKKFSTSNVHYCHGRRDWTGKTTCTRECMERDLTAAAAGGRVCQNRCTSNEQCGQGRGCVCDHECGLSCLRIGATCPPPSAIMNMASIEVFVKARRGDLQRTSPPYRYNDIAKYTCNLGFVLKDPFEQSLCHGENAWTGNPSCVSMCPRDVKAAAAVGRLCREACRPGVQTCPSGQACLCDRECGFSCIDLNNFCSIPPPIGNMARVVVYREGLARSFFQVPAAPYRYGDVARYECNPGFKIDGRINRLDCHGRKNWTNLGNVRCLLACKKHQPQEAAENNMICTSACDTDQDCHGRLRCMCDEYCGRACVNPDVDCGIAPPTLNATIKYTGSGFRKIANYICDDRFFLSSGSPSRQCTGGGTWDGRTPICERVTCGDPTPSIEAMAGEPASNFNPNPPFYAGDQYEFSCRPFHRMLGDRVRTCMSNGRWSGIDTVCDIKDDETRCPHPGVPINGVLLRNKGFAIGNVVQFACEAGYSMVGSPRQKCLYFLQWSDGGAPKCINPRYRDSRSEVLAKLQRSTEEIQGTSGNSFGRFISATFAPGHEIYFVIDISASVKNSELRNALEFCIKLIERLSVNATGEIEFGIIIFALKTKVIWNTQDVQPPPEEIIKLLQNILLDRENYQAELRRGTNTTYALEVLSGQIEFSYQQHIKTERQRHVFILTDGRHNEGAPPEKMVQAMSSRENPPQFYSITSCLECSEPQIGSDAYNELLALALGKTENFIFIENFYVIQSLLDQVTDANIDYSKCGQAGDVGNIKHLASAGRLLGGQKVNSRAWPWQVVVTRKRSKVVNTYDRRSFLGGGTIINNQWVLTASHLFGDEEPEDIVVTYGLHRRPTSPQEILLPIVRVFTATEIFVHSGFTEDNYDYDVALIKIGKEYIQDGTNWREITSFGFVNYTAYIRPVCLPCMENNCLEDHLRKPEVGLLTGSESSEEKCRVETNFLLEKGNPDKKVLTVVTGFGHTEELEQRNVGQATPGKNLLQGLIQLKDEYHCNKTVKEYIPWTKEFSLKYTDRMLCGISGNDTANVNVCRGDSGGPLVREVYDDRTKESFWVQVGIVSWGWGCGQTYRSQEPGQSDVELHIPSFYTNVMSVSWWIQKHLNVRDQK
ncbi:unnamed protein product [Clavelina lepadiformis]|uniref:C3/C5 convertase n=1 Tax=Clavelina lepadiformis TaxID=159417 RepID=A0ABP0F8B0_CLALP